ncbi:site-specific integrase [Microbacteriaceae bacterium K1510]|nr:site-specific integrase [Microbacteriaceae bacterium K1510]
MARPSYLSRRPGGRYYLQIRLGKRAAALYGRPVLRASLRTSDFDEARKRLMDSLGWAQELVSAPDLSAAGTLIRHRLLKYAAAGGPTDERALAERMAYENQVRQFLMRSHDRGFCYTHEFQDFADLWHTFVQQNTAAEDELARLDRQKHYERGWAEAGVAASRGWSPATPSITSSPLGCARRPPAPTLVGLSDAVHQTIDAVVQSAIGKHLATLSSTKPASTGAASDGERTVAPLAPALNATGLRLSEALKLFLMPPGKKRQHKMRGRTEIAVIVQFAVDFLDDPILENIGPVDWDRLDEAMPDIPLPKGIPDSHRGSLFLRYSYAQQQGWANLSRTTITTIESRYHYGLNKFIKWAIEESHYRGRKPKFVCIDENNTTPLPRDAFTEEELIKLIELPLFTGCAGAHRIWKPGRYFVQTHIYWAYLILILTGMRPGEVGQLKCADIINDGDNYFFDLRPFDARQGRIALKDLRKLKTNSSGRVVPVHPLLIELGLRNRAAELIEKGEERLFPEWDEFTRSDGTVRWSQPITKSWQYIKKAKILKVRADLTLYSTRHLMAEWLDAPGIAQRTRNRILGHASGVPGRYGRKGAPDAAQIFAIEAVEPPVIQQMRGILVAAAERARRGELVTLKPWLSARSPN